MIAPSRLSAALDEVGAAIAAAPHLLIFLDFDGTLAPIADAPDLACLPRATREVVGRLSRTRGCTVAIVSGRGLDDVRGRVGIDGLIYAGNHGLEIAGGGLRYDHAGAVGLGGQISAVVEDLTGRLRGVRGVLVEAKRLTASVHYRLARVEDADAIERAVRGTVSEGDSGLVVAAGKMVWEVRPDVEWDKGAAVRWIRERLGLRDALTIYLGDDRTDEDAFAEVGRCVTVRVGPPRPTLAGYRVEDTTEVADFLLWIAREAGRLGRARRSVPQAPHPV